MKLAVAIAIAFAIAAPETIPAPSTIPHEKGSIVVSGPGDPQRWTADWAMEPAKENGRPAVRFTETGRGRLSPYSGPVRWNIEAVWSADGSFRPLRFERKVLAMDGRTIATERKIFDPTKGTVQFDRKREGGVPEARQFPVPPDTLAPEGIAGILRFLPFEHWHPATIHLFTNEPKLYEMKLELRGTERIKTPAGEFNCYKLELVPQLGALNLVRPFLRKAYFWFSASPPHFWVRYEGPENGLGTPQIVMQLKTYER